MVRRREAASGLGVLITVPDHSVMRMDLRNSWCDPGRTESTVIFPEPPDDRSAQFGDRVVQLLSLGSGGGAGPLVVALVAFAPGRIRQVDGRRGNTCRAAL
jgi:hypothetical protein